MSDSGKKIYYHRDGTTYFCTLYTSPSDVGGAYIGVDIDNVTYYAKIGADTDTNASHLRVRRLGTTQAILTKAIQPTGTWLATLGGTSSGTNDGQFNTPRRISADALGNFIVSDTGNNRIQKVTSNLEWLWTASASSARGTSFDSSNNVFVSTSSAVMNYDVDGTYITQLTTSPVALNSVQDVQTDPSDGSIYVADYSNSRVIKMTSTGSVLWTATSIPFPTRIQLYSTYIFIASQGATPRIYRLDKNTGGSMFTFGASTGGMNGLAVTSSGEVYISDGNQYLRKYNSSGTQIWSRGGAGSASTQFNGIQGVCVDNQGFILVVDAGNNRIKRYTASGDVSWIIGGTSPGTGNSQFNSPQDVVYSSISHTFAVTELLNHRIQLFAA